MFLKKKKIKRFVDRKHEVYKLFVQHNEHMPRLRYDRVHAPSFIFNHEKCTCIYMYSVYDKKKKILIDIRLCEEASIKCKLHVY